MGKMRSCQGRRAVLDGVKGRVVDSEQRGIKRGTEPLETIAQLSNSGLGKSCDCRENGVRTGYTVVATLEGLGLSRIMDPPSLSRILDRP